MILFTVLGLGPLIAARLAWIRHPLAPVAAFVVGAALLIWVAVEIAISATATSRRSRRHTWSGALITAVALGWLAQTGLATVDRRTAKEA